MNAIESDVAVTDPPTSPASDLAARTSAELAEQIQVVTELDFTRAALNSAREERASVNRGRTRFSVLERTVSETEPELTALRVALAVAEQRERDEQAASERAERTRKTVAAVRDLVDALRAIEKAELELRALRPDAPGNFSDEIRRSREIFTTWARAIGALDA